MFKVKITRNDEVLVEEEVQALMMGTIKNENDEGHEGSTSIMGNVVTKGAMLQSLSTLVCVVIRESACDKAEESKMFADVMASALIQLVEGGGDDEERTID